MPPPFFNRKTITINGILLPATWDEMGQVSGLLIAAFDEREYYISDFENCIHWQEYLNTQVTVYGKINKLGEYTWISVRSLDPINADSSIDDSDPG